jgi:hypothetical protein
MAKETDRRIIAEDALLVLPSLALALGITEAIVLQQVHYFLTVAIENDNNYKNGYFWTYNSAIKWQKQFPFWHVNTVRNALNGLEEKGILVTGCYNKMRGDRSKWYRIDYEKLNEVIAPFNKNCEMPFNKNCEMDITKTVKCHLTEIVKPVPNTSLPNTSTNTIKDIDHFFESLWILYPFKRGKGKIKAAKKKELYKLGYEVIKKCIERYKASKEDWREWQHGSTFFNSGYVDYLDENFDERSINLGDDRGKNETLGRSRSPAGATAAEAAAKDYTGGYEGFFRNTPEPADGFTGG